MLERHNERATVGTHLVPRVDRHNDEQRPHIKHQDTHWYGIDSARNRFFRVFGFACGNPDNLNPAVSEHHHLQRHHHAEPAVAEEATIAP